MATPSTGNIAILYHTRMYNDLTVQGSLSAADHDFYVSTVDGLTCGVPATLTDNLTVRETLEVTNTKFHVKTNQNVFIDASGSGVFLTNADNVVSVLNDKVDVSGALRVCGGILSASNNNVIITKGNNSLSVDTSGTLISTSSNQLLVDASGTSITGLLNANNRFSSTSSKTMADHGNHIFEIDASGTRVTGSFAINDDFIIDGSGAVTSSDQRIKTNIIPVHSAVEVLKQISPCTYTFVDTHYHGESKTYGFIAQDVKRIVPEATHVKQGFLPNIYTWGVVKGKTIVMDERVGVQCPCIIRITSPVRIHGLAASCNNNVIQYSDMDLVDGMKVFVYGSQVDDFHYLDKDVIYTIAVAAVKELENEVSNQNAKVRELEKRLEDIEVKLSKRASLDDQ